jgi:four helix bundle protein
MSSFSTKSNSLPYARRFTDLVVYQKARTLARDVFKVSKKLPREEAYALTDQWHRAARSVGAQISEAWAKRRYVKHFVSKLSDADGEQMEIQHWTITAYDAGYITREEAHHIGGQAQEIGRILGDMMQNVNAFCGGEFGSTLQETPKCYFAESVPEDQLVTEY